ncbi:DUF2809 domain-containing protein [Peteryoungia ipomoeae]|uniref:DUF2809 domain-containing protein n=1 Tax=Peteryoungia ipomoeae TaxID=1210932 RepID=A0A4S8PBC4_9HYPH|nr:DUF2809 domain-containing protein [Peteryoungia ipomoeae]THV25454.1 DUF2809 domain-containing protein [Peteryoungia ipomoeae]
MQSMKWENRSERLWKLGWALVAIVAGVTLRLTGYEAGLPYALVKYGGSALWGAMVYLLIAAALPGRLPLHLTVAATIAILAELFRLYHTPWLDEFRLTLAGALLFGRIFSLWNIVAYLAGIGIAALLDRKLAGR